MMSFRYSYRCALSLATILAACSLNLSAGQETACQDLTILGTPNWERYDGKIDIIVDDDCMYTWTATFKHDETLPIPDDPANQCNPGVQPPVLADDGLPYYAFRWSFYEPSEYFKNVTGIDHISYDFNPCGHPPIGVFTVPHYDMHTYRVSPEYRTCMQCDLLPGTPVCNFNEGMQTTEAGLKFFEPVDRDIPPRFLVQMGDMVPVMGGHAWDPATQPVSAYNWTEPVMVTGYYGNQFLYYEPMPPLSFVSGDADTFWEQELTYQNQTIADLATYVSVSYNATTGLATYTFKGPSNVCNEVEDPPSVDDPPTDDPSIDDPSAARAMPCFGASVIMAGLFATVLGFN